MQADLITRTLGQCKDNIQQFIFIYSDNLHMGCFFVVETKILVGPLTQTRPETPKLIAAPSYHICSSS